MTLCLDMYAPLALNSFAREGSTRDTHWVTLLTLSLGVSIPQLEHCTSSLLPLPPLLRPLDLRFFGVPFTNPWADNANLTTNSLLRVEACDWKGFRRQASSSLHVATEELDT